MLNVSSKAVSQQYDSFMSTLQANLGVCLQLPPPPAHDKWHWFTLKVEKQIQRTTVCLEEPKIDIAKMWSLPEVR